ncbi:hypothetical protein KAW65_07650 [candidate division WOR-3 bacterium]|nr:hypothetical protein [candidate division WOR-3 bacterium]
MTGGLRDSETILKQVQDDIVQNDKFARKNIVIALHRMGEHIGSPLHKY